MKINIIGGGLAGSEAAYYLLKKGHVVTLFEARPSYQDNAHETDLFGELVCSNSLKSKLLTNACGLLKEEMKIFGSLLVEAAMNSEVPAGQALAVDRQKFAEYITNKLKSFPNLVIKREEITGLLEGQTIIATGPLTSPTLLKTLNDITGENNLSFFDASAPLIKKDSIDFNIAYYKSRFDQDDDAYINCPFNKEQYFAFVDALLKAERATLHSFDTQYFEGCLPVEIMAERGRETLRYGPLKPFGLRRIENERAPFAVAQLRQDDLLGDVYNLVGFQTNLTYPAQKEVFRLIPGLENAEFVRYGLMHRNAFFKSSRILNEDFSFKSYPNLYLAGQITGVEGYVESAASGLLTAIYLDQKLQGKELKLFPNDTILGALAFYVTHANPDTFSPMNATWELLHAKKKERELAIQRSKDSVSRYKMMLDE